MWHPAKLAIAERAMDEPDIVLFFHDAWLIDGMGKRTGPANIFSLPESNPPLSVYSFFSPFGFSMVCHRSLLALSNLWARSTDSNDRRERAPHDQWLFFLATVLGTVRFSPERLTEYRQHVANAVGQPAPTGRCRGCGARASIGWAIQRRGFAIWRRSRTTGPTSWRRVATCCRGRAGTGGSGPRALSGTGVAVGIARRTVWRSARNRASETPSAVAAERLYGGASAWDFTHAALMKDAMLGVALRPLLVWASRRGQRLQIPKRYVLISHGMKQHWPQREMLVSI